MQYTFDRFRSEATAALQRTGRVPADLLTLSIPKADVPADLAFPAFRAAHVAGSKPPDFARELAAALAPPHDAAPSDSLIGAAEAAGPYVNFSVHPARFAASVLHDITTTASRYGHDTSGTGQTVVIDYSSPNVAKRMHVGHIRSTIIGQALVNIHRALGYTVIGDNHIGDWGKQFGVILASIEREGKPAAEGETALAELEAMYTRYNAAMQHDPTLDERAREWSLQLEQGDPHARALWQWTVDITLQANQRNYDRLGVQFDHTYGESYYEDMLPRMIDEAIASGAATRDPDGSVAVKELDPDIFLLQRNDGGTLYMTRDVATIAFRMQTFHPTRMVYVVGTPQSAHFRQLFALVRAMGYVGDDVKLVHVSFGSIFDTAGNQLSTRRGNMVYLQTLLDEAHTRARAIIEGKNPDLPAAEKDAIAEAVGVGAVIYNDLYQDTKRNITLDWERMLATEGNSATYLQYSYARCRSILRRAAADGYAPTDDATQHAHLTHPAEQALLRQLAHLPAAIRDAGHRYAPFVLADWCYTTAREFAVFFEQCPVLRAESNDLRAARLALVAATAQALANALHLLGIRTPERM